MKRLIGHDLGTYAFNATAGTLTFSGLPAITQDQILLVTDTKTGAILYNFADPSNGGTLAGAVLTFANSTAALNNADPLQVYIDLPADGAILASGTLSASGPGAAIGTQGAQSVVLQINGAAWGGAITVEGSLDQSVGSWLPQVVMNLSELAAQDVITENGTYVIKASALYLRLNVLGINGTAPAYVVIGRASVGDYGADRMSMALDQSTQIGLSTFIKTLGQQASSQSVPVTLAADQQDAFLIGPTGLMGINNDLLTGGGNPVDTLAGWATSFRSFACEVDIPAGYAAGQFIFEGSNSQVGWNPLTVFDDGPTTGTTINAAITPTANTQRFFSGKIQYRYLRLRISTAFTGAAAQAIIRLSPLDYVPRVMPVGQATIANLNATVNESQYGGSAVVNGGVAGLPGVGGNIAIGTAPTANPVPIGGRDSTTTVAGVAAPVTRMLLLDTAGRAQVGDTAVDPGGIIRSLGALLGGQVPALATRETGAADGGYDLLQILLLMLTELKIIAQYLYEQPTVLQGGGCSLTAPEELRGDPTLFPL